MCIMLFFFLISVPLNTQTFFKVTNNNDIFVTSLVDYVFCDLSKALFYSIVGYQWHFSVVSTVASEPEGSRFESQSTALL